MTLPALFSEHQCVLRKYMCLNRAINPIESNNVTNIAGTKPSFNAHQLSATTGTKPTRTIARMLSWFAIKSADGGDNL